MPINKAACDSVTTNPLSYFFFFKKKKGSIFCIGSSSAKMVRYESILMLGVNCISAATGEQ
jgi:hypothetical protein